MIKKRYRIPVASPIVTEEDINAVVQALREKRLSSGKCVEDFEKLFASYIGTKYAVGVSSGTAALHICLKAIGVGPGCEVITTPNSFIATAEVIVLLGAEPVFVDIEPETYNINPSKIEEAVTEKTKAIMPIHYGGQCAEMDEIMEIAERHGLYVIEDAAPAHGAIYKGRKAGTLGDAAGFSFFPDKNMTTGEGGMITTANEEIADKARILRTHGATARYHHVEVGWNYRMIDYAAAMGISQLKRLEWLIERKNQLAKYYSEHLEGIEGVQPPLVRPYNRHVFMLYSIRTEKLTDREKIREALEKEGVQTRINFPPIHLQPAYAKLFGYTRGMFPVAEKIGDTILGLPIGVDLSEEDQELIVNTIRRSIS